MGDTEAGDTRPKIRTLTAAGDRARTCVSPSAAFSSLDTFKTSKRFPVVGHFHAPLTKMGSSPGQHTWTLAWTTVPCTDLSPTPEAPRAGTVHLSSAHEPSVTVPSTRHMGYISPGLTNAPNHFLGYYGWESLIPSGHCPAHRYPGPASSAITQMARDAQAPNAA